MTTRTGFQTIEDVKAANEEAGQFWFSPSTMQFFSSQIETELFAGRWFVTSEEGPDEVRAYTIWEAHEGGMVDTVGEFQGYRTREAAVAAIQILS